MRLMNEISEQVPTIIIQKKTFLKFRTFLILLYFQNQFRIGLRWDRFPAKKWKNNTVPYVISHEYGK